MFAVAKKQETLLKNTTLQREEIHRLLVPNNNSRTQFLSY